MKKCNKCKESGVEFSKNKHLADGFSKTCKKCLKEITQERRRRLDVMLKGVEVKFHAKFKELHKQWTNDGFPPHSKPVVVGSKCLTFIESKGVLRSRMRSQVVLVGDVDLVFYSISQASRETGDSRLYIKWSADNDSCTEGRNLWKILNK